MSDWYHSGLVRYHSELVPLMVDIDSVHQAAYNANNGAVEDIIESIETSGMYRPIIVHRETGDILAGNHTWEACKSLEATEIPVVYIDTDDPERIMVADNYIASLAIPDPALFAALLDTIAESEEGLRGTGVNEQVHENLRKLADSALTDADFAMWPVITFRIPPHLRKAFYEMTVGADDELGRFQLLMEMAGYQS